MCAHIHTTFSVFTAVTTALLFYLWNFLQTSRLHDMNASETFYWQKCLESSCKSTQCYNPEDIFNVARTSNLTWHDMFPKSSHYHQTMFPLCINQMMFCYNQFILDMLESSPKLHVFQHFCYILRILT